jgi:hypothetical protein
MAASPLCWLRSAPVKRGAIDPEEIRLSLISDLFHSDRVQGESLIDSIKFLTMGLS